MGEQLSLPSCYCLQMMFHDIVVLGVVMAAGWGLFGALVAMTCTHDARYSPSLLPSLPFFSLFLSHSTYDTCACIIVLSLCAAILPSLTSRGSGEQLVVYMISFMEPLYAPGFIRWVTPCSLSCCTFELLSSSMCTHHSILLVTIHTQILMEQIQT